MGRYAIGRSLQFIGLLILPFAIASELVGRFGLGQSMLVAAGGAASLLRGLCGSESHGLKPPSPREPYATCIFSGQSCRTISFVPAFSIIGEGIIGLWYSICCCVDMMI